MSIDAWIAIGGLAVALVSGIVAGVLHAMKTSYSFGQHSERLRQAEEKIGHLESAREESHKNETAVALLTQAMHALQERFDKLDHDLRGWVMGKSKPPRASIGQD